VHPPGGAIALAAVIGGERVIREGLFPSFFLCFFSQERKKQNYYTIKDTGTASSQP
jgi:hypothetical protein